jgi:hypothetical protein|tara:strand:+ start:290 stop:568 length:279 start_codon:yes stop_codon:yes gene_type:complete
MDANEKFVEFGTCCSLMRDEHDYNPYEMLSVREANGFIRFVRGTPHEVLLNEKPMLIGKDFIDYWKPIYSSMGINKLKRRLKSESRYRLSYD